MAEWERRVQELFCKEILESRDNDDVNKVFRKRQTKQKLNDCVQNRTPNLRNKGETHAIDLSTMSPDHQVDEQLNLAVLSTFRLILKAFLDCVIN